MSLLALATFGQKPPAGPPDVDLGTSPWGSEYLSIHGAATDGDSIGECLTAAASANVGIAVTPGRARLVTIAPGTYTEKLTGLTQYVALVGEREDPADTVIYWPNDVGSGQIRQYPLEVAGSIYLKNLTIIGEYQSYALHADGNSGGAGFPTQLIAENVVFKNTAGHNAIGLGSGGRQEMYYKDCVMETTGGGGQPILGHNQADQAYPSLVVFDGCTVTGSGDGVNWPDVDSGQPDVWIFTNGTFDVPGTDLGVGVVGGGTVEGALINYYVDPGTSVSGVLSARVSNTIPSPLPHWTDADSVHNVYFNLYQ